MNELKALNILKNELGFSYNSIRKLKIFHNYLLDYNKRYNLISNNSEKSIWIRHILDSAQIIRFIKDSKDLKIADFGSGAGFPGLIIGLYNENVRFHVKLYEKSPVKRAFLKNIKKKLDIKGLDIENNVYEKEKILADVIVCRAFKKLEEILKISREIVKKPHKLIILKGKNAQSEINRVSLGSNYSYKLANSMTNEDSKIILIDVK
ncbi:MAG: 16S rRNA (guanine(527)-N(7))-methyltransferase RsmG [Candidatus Pelagibacter sp. TMED153]|nr:MAG: 16S rRNA (guanine(527)-N(7))-methyltransferase RsmG [Candidatus Pelagibacter sp. TMED153]|tara:strand:+ start:600 stop:1220 length:621 start_codon:yes stop_codon:yes gene_type:complete